LPRESLDELRLLSNLDFDRTPPFTLILAGQPPLRETLALPELASLAQRLPLRASLSLLTDRETVDYLDRRLRAVGAQATLFRPGAADKVFEKSRGVPREINNVATAALLAAAAAGKKHVDVREVEDAVFDRESV
jgi:type II secretory pathway predicted ATPase ExeA